MTQSDQVQVEEQPSTTELVRRWSGSYKKSFSTDSADDSSIEHSAQPTSALPVLHEALNDSSEFVNSGATPLLSIPVAYAGGESLADSRTQPDDRVTTTDYVGMTFRPVESSQWRRVFWIAPLVLGVMVLLTLGLRSLFAPTAVPQNQDRNSPIGRRGKVEMALVKGGRILMGRDDVLSSDIQYPAHEVDVPSFFMDKTEVTNEEYAEFVRDTGHAAPQGSRSRAWTPWSGRDFPAGQERWPIRNVSLDDAQAFTQWLSNRDHISYKLPTEEQWEFAARGGDSHQLYPWGNEWLAYRTNVDSESTSVREVGSFPSGCSSNQICDLIGNVAEFTTTTAFMYPHNPNFRVPNGQTGFIVIRGGSFQSKSREKESVTSTYRRFISPSTKDPAIGFRLVRDAP
jgi:formylglycine-generating enzyme required for sulfatase activity